ncbi:phosphatidylcholine and lysophosphatidylcholine phospholipase [Terramyces sp. JEL0728]|nr:phosphatidylcholine and lysophosphatidylcholine phospholipase [Terramyces sp. JEL0728]
MENIESIAASSVIQEASLTTAAVVSSVTASVDSHIVNPEGDSLATTIIIKFFTLVFGHVPWTIYRILSYTVTASITLDFWAIMWLTTLSVIVITVFYRYKLYAQYASLEPTDSNPRTDFDLKPDIALDENLNTQGYPGKLALILDDFMNAFLSSIKIFGYLDKPVFHELTRHLQTRKLKAGDLLFEEESYDRDFYVVVEGKVQVFIKGLKDDENEIEVGEEGDSEWGGHHLLNEVKSGGTVSSLFAILSILSEDLEMPQPLVAKVAERPKSSLSDTKSESSVDTNKELDGQMTPIAEVPTEGNSAPFSVDGAYLQELDTPKVEEKKTPDKPRSVYPNLVARAAANTTLAVIPAEAFYKLSEKFPKAAGIAFPNLAHMALVILTRFQRVTFLTLHRYLGLSKELLTIEQRVNEITGSGLPADLFPPDLIEQVSWRLSHQRKEEDTPSPQSTDLNSNIANNSPVRRGPRRTGRRDDFDMDHDFTFENYRKSFHDEFSETHSQAFTTGDPDEKVRDAIFACISQLIGFNLKREPNKDAEKNRHLRTSVIAAQSSVERFYYSTRRSSIASTSHSQDRRYIDRDDISVSSRASSIGDGDFNEVHDSPDIELLYFKEGEMLLREGERCGIYFVLDGTLETSIDATPTDQFMSSKNKKKGGKKGVFLVRPGGIAGYLTALTSNLSFVNIQAKTDVLVGYMPKPVLDRYLEKYPNALLCLAKRLVCQLSPLVFHIDVALEWGQINAGQVLSKQGDPSQSIYIVLTGRLRSIREVKQGSTSTFEIQNEYGHSESVGEMEVLVDAPRASTVHAIRDSEIAIMPKTLFNALAIQHPDIMITIGRMIATRSASDINSKFGNDNENLKTVALLPLSNDVPILEFAEKLNEAITELGSSTALLFQRAITSQLGKHAFTRLGRLKLISWLAEQEESHRIVVYVADGGDGDPSICEVDHKLLSMKTTARKELVLLHEQRSVTPGTTAFWLKPRKWIQAHHHVQISIAAPTALKIKQNPKQMTFGNLGAHFKNYYSQISPKSSTSPNIYSGNRSDFARIARRLLSKSIGLCLGGGGARGISHVGVIRAFEEVGIPIDMVGGTSMGAFVGGLYARSNDHVSVMGRAKFLCMRMTSLWRQIIDLTYPVTALMTGNEFNRGIWKCFLDTQIEDCWLPYFAITANITHSTMGVHQHGYMWRFVRASMSLSGYLPPLCHDGSMLMDGGYLNNVPADVMKNLGARYVVAVDVGRPDDTSPTTYGDSLSGWWVLFKRFNPFGKNYGQIPTVSDIQSRLMYASSVPRLEAIQKLEGCLYITPPVQGYAIMQFGSFAEIEQVGYDYARKMIQAWNDEGILFERFGVKLERNTVTNRRASI